MNVTGRRLCFLNFDGPPRFATSTCHNERKSTQIHTLGVSNAPILSGSGPTGQSRNPSLRTVSQWVRSWDTQTQGRHDIFDGHLSLILERLGNAMVVRRCVGSPENVDSVGVQIN